MTRLKSNGPRYKRGVGLLMGCIPVLLAVGCWIGLGRARAIERGKTFHSHPVSIDPAREFGLDRYILAGGYISREGISEKIAVYPVSEFQYGIFAELKFEDGPEGKRHIARIMDIMWTGREAVAE